MKSITVHELRERADTPLIDVCEVDEFAAGHGAAGPVQMAGKVSVWRRRPTAGTRGPGHLELVRPRPASATRPASASPEERREG